MRTKEQWDALLETVRRRRTAAGLQSPLERAAWLELEGYLKRAGISLGRDSGPHYLMSCYHLYRVEGVEPSPEMLAAVAQAYERRMFHVRRALYLLQLKLERRCPQEGEQLPMYAFLARLFRALAERPLQDGAGSV